MKGISTFSRDVTTTSEDLIYTLKITGEMLYNVPIFIIDMKLIERTFELSQTPVVISYKNGKRRTVSIHSKNSNKSVIIPNSIINEQHSISCIDELEKTKQLESKIFKQVSGKDISHFLDSSMSIQKQKSKINENKFFESSLL